MRLNTLIPLLLPLGLMAADPASASFRILPLDTKAGLAVMDLKPEELKVRVGETERKVLRIEAPRADVPVRWILVFEPIRDGRYRTLAFLSATEFLRKLPDGDEVLMVVRTKENFQSLSPSFSLDRSEWVRALSKAPELLPEFLTSPVKDGGTTLDVDLRKVVPQGDAEAGRKALDALSGRILKEQEKFSKGQVERGTISWAKNPSEILLVQQEAKSLSGLLQQFKNTPGDKHVLIFSRTVSDEVSQPETGQSKWGETVVNSRTGAKAVTTDTNQTLAITDVRVAREGMKKAMAGTDLIIHSIAGSGTHQIGFCGELAQSTGGQAITFMNGLEQRLPGQLMSYRDCVQVTYDATESKGGALSVTSTRPNLKIYHPTLQ